MHCKILWITVFVLTIVGCNHNQNQEDSHSHEEFKIQYTAYSDSLELFAEADPFVVGESANILSHFTFLSNFKPLEAGEVTAILTINGKEVTQKLDAPVRKGIYSFDITPKTEGKGVLKFEISRKDSRLTVIISNVTVFGDHHEAHEAHEAEETGVSNTNASVFTKEQSWKIDFATDSPKIEPFGQVIKTTAQVQSLQGNEIVLSARTNGVVSLSSSNILEGNEVKSGQVLFTISGNDLADNNSSVRYTEAKNNFEKAKSDYERARELAKDKIVSERDLLAAKTTYENSKTVYENLNRNFNASGQRVTSPMNGFVKQMNVRNGSYVEIGQPLLTISQNKSFILSADVPQKYASVLNSVWSANIKNLHENSIYTFEQLNGKILSFGRATNDDNYHIPVKLQIDNKGSFTAGSFVEVYLKTATNAQALTIPNAALMEEQGNFFVWVQVNPELFEKREITIGGTDGKKTEIRKGLSPYERIVTKGAILLKLSQPTGSLDAHSGHVH